MVCLPWEEVAVGGQVEAGGSIGASGGMGGGIGGNASSTQVDPPVLILPP